MTVTPEEQLAETVRREGARVLATLVRTLGSLQLAEDAVQDAAVAALQTWPRDGIPGDPRAWLTVTARHKAYDALRREAARPGKELAAGGATPVVPDLASEVLDMVEPGTQPQHRAKPHPRRSAPDPCGSALSAHLEPPMAR